MERSGRGSRRGARAPGDPTGKRAAGSSASRPSGRLGNAARAQQAEPPPPPAHPAWDARRPIPKAAGAGSPERSGASPRIPLTCTGPSPPRTHGTQAPRAPNHLRKRLEEICPPPGRATPPLTGRLLQTTPCRLSPPSRRPTPLPLPLASSKTPLHAGPRPVGVGGLGVLWPPNALSAATCLRSGKEATAWVVRGRGGGQGPGE